MDFKPHVSFSLNDRSFQNIIKRDIAKLAEGFGFNQTEVGKINIIVSEMSSNLLKHNATAGEILVKPFGKNHSGFEIICLDLGPGMSDPQRMLEDGISTVGTSGEGLGAIKRLSDEFDLCSRRGVGTIILARIYKSKLKPKTLSPKKFDFGVVMVPKTGETFCGDAWAMHEDAGVCRVLVADGLGHGEFAEQASQQVVEVFLQNTVNTPTETIRNIHSAVKRTRGAVANVASINLRNQSFSYCGVGNIAGRILNGLESKNIISYNGILGHNIPNTLHDHTIDWSNNSLLVMHSDGIKSKWDLTRMKDMQRHDPSVTAAFIYKNFNRGTDDTLVLVGRSRG